MEIYLRDIDPSRDFVAQGRFLAAGTWYAKGDPIDKDAMPPRLLTKLYRARKIGYADGANPIRPLMLIPSKPARRAPDEPQDGEGEASEPEPLTDEEQAQVKALVDGNSRDDLVKMAEGLEYPASGAKAVIATAIVEAKRGTA